jgi:beta-xylosidase
MLLLIKTYAFTHQKVAFWKAKGMLLQGKSIGLNYINPVLNADFSDPDVIRVGQKYYMVASDFHFIGMQVLESDDMVNWRYEYPHHHHPPKEHFPQTWYQHGTRSGEIRTSCRID